MKARSPVIVVLSLVLLVSTAPPSAAHVLDSPATFQPPGQNGLTTSAGVTGLSGISPSNPSSNFPCESAGWTTVFYAGFDSVVPPSLPAGWSSVTVNGPLGKWQTNAGTHQPPGASAASPPNLVYFNSFVAPAGQTARLYRTTALDLRRFSDPFLCLQWYRDSGYSNKNDTVQPQVSTNGGSSWTNVGIPLTRYYTSAGWWTIAISIDSVAAGNSSVQIGFLGTSEYGNDVHLDDIQVTAIPSIYLPLLRR